MLLLLLGARALAASVTVEVTGPLADITVARTLHHEGGPLDLVFAVPPDAAVDRMVVTVGEDRVESKVVAREVAREQHARATAAGQLAATLEAGRPGEVVQRIDNVRPGEDVQLEVHLVQTLTRRAGVWELVLPAALAPGDELDARVSVRADVAWIESPSHAFRRERSGLAIAAPAGRDVVVQWATAAQDPALSLWVAGEYALLQLEAPAPWARAAPAPYDLVLVLDARDPRAWAQVLAASRALLARLREEDRVTVLVFADGVRGVAVRERATEDLRERVLGALGAVPLGGQGGLPLALRFAGSLPVPPDRAKTVVVVSSGRADQALPAVPNATVHAVAVGDAPDWVALRALVRGGVAAAAADGVADALAGPILTDVAAGMPQMAPATVPPLYADGAVTVAAAGLPCAPLMVRGRYLGRPFAEEVTPTCTGPVRAVEVAWARARVDALAAEGRHAEAAEVALAHGIVSRYTSLFGADSTVRAPRDRVAGLVEYEERAVDYAAEVQAIEVAATRLPVEADAASVGGFVRADWVRVLPERSSPLAAAWGSGALRPAVEYDGHDVTDLAGALPAAWADMAAVETDGLTAPVAAPRVGLYGAGTNDLDAWVWGAANTDGAAAQVDAGLAGPLVRDRVWAKLVASHAARDLAGVSHRAERALVTATAQPVPEHRTSAGGFVDAATLAFDGRIAPIGGAGAWIRHQVFPSPSSNLDFSADAGRQQLDGAVRERVHASGHAQAHLTSHDLAAGAAWTGLRWRAGDAGFVSAYASDHWGLRGRAWLDVGARLDGRVVSPRLIASVDPWGDQRTKLAAGLSRWVDVTRWVPRDVADPARSDRVHLDIQREVIQDVAVRLLAVAARERLPFLSTPQLLDLPSERAPTVERAIGAVSLVAEKIESRRWQMRLEAKLAFAPPLDPALASDPAAPLVPGFLDPHRRWALGATARWDLPLDPYTLTLGGFARWASAIEPGGPWWLDETAVAGATLRQHIDVRRGSLWVGATALWAKNDLGATTLPPEAYALLGDRVGPLVEPRTRLELRIGYEY